MICYFFVAIFQKRDNGQNKYYHKYIKNVLAEIEGIDPDEMHNKLLIKYNGSEKVRIVSEDLLKNRLNISGEYKLFSNIPFTITSDIMTKFLSDNRVQEIYFIMQYEAFLRFCGTPLYQDSYKSLLYKPFFSMEILYRFAPSDFTPMPSVRIVFVHIARKKSFDISKTDFQG